MVGLTTTTRGFEQFSEKHLKHSSVLTACRSAGSVFLVGFLEGAGISFP